MKKSPTVEEIIWVSNGMPQEILEKKIADLQSQGKRIIVFRSGHGDLTDLTGELLRINKDLEL